jgi:hypothetical protein
MDLEEDRVTNCGLDSCGSGEGPVAGFFFCEHGNAPSDTIKGGKFDD